MTLQPQPVDRTLWFEATLLPDGWGRDVRIGIAGGRIVSLEPGVARSPADEGGGVALPGVANVHSHAFQRAMAGLTEAVCALQAGACRVLLVAFEGPVPEFHRPWLADEAPPHALGLVCDQRDAAKR